MLTLLDFVKNEFTESMEWPSYDIAITFEDMEIFKSLNRRWIRSLEKDPDVKPLTQEESVLLRSMEIVIKRSQRCIFYYNPIVDALVCNLSKLNH